MVKIRWRVIDKVTLLSHSQRGSYLLSKDSAVSGIDVGSLRRRVVLQSWIFREAAGCSQAGWSRVAGISARFCRGSICSRFRLSVIDKISGSQESLVPQFDLPNKTFATPQRRRTQ